MALIINPNAKSGSDFNQMFPHLSAKDFDDYIYYHNSNPNYTRSAYFWSDGKDVFMETFLGDTDQIQECCHEYIKSHNDTISSLLSNMSEHEISQPNKDLIIDVGFESLNANGGMSEAAVEADIKAHEKKYFKYNGDEDEFIGQIPLEVVYRRESDTSINGKSIEYTVRIERSRFVDMISSPYSELSENDIPCINYRKTTDSGNPELFTAAVYKENDFSSPSFQAVIEIDDKELVRQIKNVADNYEAQHQEFLEIRRENSVSGEMSRRLDNGEIFATYDDIEKEREERMEENPFNKTYDEVQEKFGYKSFEDIKSQYPNAVDLSSSDKRKMTYKEVTAYLKSIVNDVMVTSDGDKIAISDDYDHIEKSSSFSTLNRRGKEEIKTYAAEIKKLVPNSVFEKEINNKDPAKSDVELFKYYSVPVWINNRAYSVLLECGQLKEKNNSETFLSDQKKRFPDSATREGASNDTFTENLKSKYIRKTGKLQVLGISYLYNLKSRPLSNNPLTEYMKIEVNGKERECKNGVLEGFKNAVRQLDSVIDTNHELCDENNRLVMENIRLKDQLTKRNHNLEQERG